MIKETRCLIDQGYYEDAIVQLSRYLQIDSWPIEKASILKELAYCYLRMGWYAEAVKAGKQSLAINPSDNDTRFYLASAYASLKWTDEAIEELRSLLEADPVDVLSYHDLALCYRDKGWLKESLEVMRRANADAKTYGDPVDRELIEKSLANLEHENEEGGDNNFKNFLLFMILLLILMKKKKNKF